MSQYSIVIEVIQDPINPPTSTLSSNKLATAPKTPSSSQQNTASPTVDSSTNSHFPKNLFGLLPDHSAYSSSAYSIPELSIDPGRDLRFGPIVVDWFDFMPTSQSADNDREQKSDAEVKGAEVSRTSYAAVAASTVKPSTAPSDITSVSDPGHDDENGGDKDADPLEQVSFVVGRTNLHHGVIHLYREHYQRKNADSGEGVQTASAVPKTTSQTILAVLAVPTHMTPADFLSFIGTTVEELLHVRLLRDGAPHRYIALLKFRTADAASEFLEEFNGRPFSALEPEICQVVPVKSVQLGTSADPSDPERQFTFMPVNLSDYGESGPEQTNDLNIDTASSKKTDTEAVATTTPQNDQFELPTCPVCLERMDTAITGLMTISCLHTFHCRCLGKWGNGRCPVCRFSLADPANDEISSANRNGNQCAICGTEDNLWICLICGRIGCGRYAAGHASQHYERTGHLYALDLVTQRVWDYAGDGYVHRILQSKTDGKLVELPEDDRTGMERPQHPSIPQEKADAMATEYTRLLTTHLDSQRHYYEKELMQSYEQLEIMRSRLDDQEQQLHDAAHLFDRHRQTTEELERVNKERAMAERKAEKLERRVSLLEGMWKEERELNESLCSNQEQLKRDIEARNQELKELREQVRDMMVFMSARDRIESGELGEEIQDGSASVGEKETSGRRNRRGKRR